MASSDMQGLKKKKKKKVAIFKNLNFTSRQNLVLKSSHMTLQNKGEQLKA